MNWLTAHLAEVESFGPIHERSIPIDGSTLRRLPFEVVEQELISVGTKADFSPVRASVAEAYLFTEPHDGARERMESLRPYEGGEQPTWFTTGLIGPDGYTLYLPDDEPEDFDVQLFVGPDLGPVSRIHVAGDIRPYEAHLTSVRHVEPDDCLDGPACRRELPDPCGEGCECCDFLELRDTILRRLADFGRRGRKEVITSKCHRHPPS